MNKIQLLLLLLSFVSISQSFSQRNIDRFIYEKIADSLLYSFEFSPKVLKINTETVCDCIKMAVSNAKLPSLDANIFDRLDSMRVEQFEIFLTNYEDSILMLEQEKYALYFLCKKEFDYLSSQINLNNKKKKHCLRAIDIKKAIIKAPKSYKGQYFALSNPIFF